MNKYTIVGIHDSGLGWILHVEADSAQKALEDFGRRNKGTALAVLAGHHENLVQRNLWPGKIVSSVAALGHGPLAQLVRASD